MVQTVQKTVKIPHAFLDMVLARRCCNDRCRMVETVQKTVESLWTAVSAAAMVSQMSWITSISGDGDLGASSSTVSNL